MDGTAKVNLSEVLNLSEQKADLKIRNAELMKMLAELQIKNEDLGKKLSSEQPVKVVTKTIILRKDPYSSTYTTDYKDIAAAEVSYTNLDGVKAELQKQAEELVDKELTELRVNSKKLANEILNSKTDLEIKEDEYKTFTKIETSKFKQKADDLELSFQEKIKSLKSDVKSLNEELIKERTNKTSEELEAKRTGEIKILKKRIAVLESEVNKLMGLSLLNRWWYRITNRQALKDARKELEIERQVVNGITTPGINRTNWFDIKW